MAKKIVFRGAELWGGIPLNLIRGKKVVVLNGAVEIYESNTRSSTDITDELANSTTIKQQTELNPILETSSNVCSENTKNDVIVLSDSDDSVTDSPVLIVKCCGYGLYHSDFDTLKPHKWINDKIINSYMKLLMKHTEKVFITNTFFYIKLKQKDYRSLNRWLKNVNFFEMSKILIPIHIPGHWSLISIDVKCQKIKYYDSLGICNAQCIKKFKFFILKLANERKKKLRPHWKCFNVKGIPRQKNTSDCGIFLCQYARCICEGYDKNIPFSAKDTVKLRRHMTEELLHCQLLPLYNNNHYRVGEN